MFTIRHAVAALCSFAVTIPATAISINQFNVPITEDFDTLAATGSSSTLPAGWNFSETGSSANSTYTAGSGNSTAGDTYSFGATASTDRALGTLLTGSLVSTLSVTFTNNTSDPLTRLAIAYDGEQWRLGSTGRTDRLDFAFSLDGTTWMDVDALDFLAPNSSGTVGALDGNAATNRLAIGFTLEGLNIATGASVWLRWSDFAAAGSDDGLAIDNFSLTAVQALPPPGSNPVPDRLPLIPIATLLFGLTAVGSARVRSKRTGSSARTKMPVTPESSTIDRVGGMR